MSKVGANSLQIFQHLLNALEVNSNVKLNNQNHPNFKLQKYNSYFDLQLDNDVKSYLFAYPDAQINQLDSNTNLSHNSRALSIVEVLKYFYIKNQSNSSPIKSRSQFLELCNHFMVALNSNRVYNNIQQVKWSEWNVYWSTPDHKAICYSNCSGQCTESCAGGQCIYYFPQNELNNPNLPAKEKQDPNNSFNDSLFQIASIFNIFVQEEKSNFESFFFFTQKQEVQIDQLVQKQNEIQVEFLQGNVLGLGSLEELYKLEKSQIRSLSILTLLENSQPKGEEERKILYDFILSLHNLVSLEIQLEEGIYSIIEEGSSQDPHELAFYKEVPPAVVQNFVTFLTSLNIERLSLILDEFCLQASIDLNPIISHLSSLKLKLKTLQLSINHRRMSNAQHILLNICKMQQLEHLNLKIKYQWSYFHGTFGSIEEDFNKWEVQLKSSIKNLKSLKIE
ncbi:hypothetical protein TTHERM_00582310 (macronuclear) [Tetrahymena thermophila SB210]|uniref:Uncharacterized protein n=1 Tax=Tetrahymena thermophila (strain SB210) TaxID=312017 RepID=Q23Q59_TETTS|nr:hypothetical protein TTHERM_00582310 [Tetrahymena thermophila SB210]EAR98725.1 hypothetical protein TTHERM_00582310 [Tetrahymena thermophila SB210]|eukprot:XP_001018970.1 hypothetical protein TTHERM_00582310 [Tetrahymena thermophila SB210]